MLESIKINGVSALFKSLIPTDGNYIAFLSGDQNTITLLHLDSFQIHKLSGFTGSILVDCVDAIITSDVLIVGSHDYRNRTVPSITRYKINLTTETITKEDHEVGHSLIIPESYSSWDISVMKMESDYLIVAMNQEMDYKIKDARDPEILLWKKQELYGEPWKVLKPKARYNTSALKTYDDIYCDGGSIIALEGCGKIFRWENVETYINEEPEEVCDITQIYQGGWPSGLNTLRVGTKEQLIVWDLFWCENIMTMKEPDIISRDPSSTHGHPEWTDPEPDYTVRIDPACQFKAVIANDSRNIRIRRILDKHDEPASNNEIDIPVSNTVELELGKFKDAFLHRQLTGPDKDALYIIYIASDGFHKQKIPNTPVDSLPIADTTHPTTRYITYHWGEYQDSLKRKVKASYDKDPADVELLTDIKLLRHGGNKIVETQQITSLNAN